MRKTIGKLHNKNVQKVIVLLARSNVRRVRWMPRWLQPWTWRSVGIGGRADASELVAVPALRGKKAPRTLELLCRPRE